jgi:cyclic pyranopterin phosphate synthase
MYKENQPEKYQPNNLSAGLSHIDQQGGCQMVDVSHKPVTFRQAAAEGRICLAPATIELIQQHKVAKGNVLEAARLSGICAAKHTPFLIPLCHPIQLTHIEIKMEIIPAESCVLIQSSVKCAERTGVEMEALTAVSLAALTIYDMCKAVDKGMRITDIRLVKKSKTDLSSHP